MSATLPVPPAAPPVIASTPPALAPRVWRLATPPESVVQHAVRRWELQYAAPVALGTDLSGQIVAKRSKEAIEAGYLRIDGTRLLLTLAGLQLLQTEQVDTVTRRAQEEAAYLKMVAESYEVARRARAAYQERTAARGLELALLDRMRALLEELAALRDALGGLDACPPAEARCAAARPVRASWCAGARATRGPVCWSRQPSCIEPRRQPVLRVLIGGRMEPTPAAVRARRAFEEQRARHQLLLAGRRHRGAWGWWPTVGADLGPFLSNTRKLRRHQRPLFVLGLLEQDAVVHVGSQQRLTAAGAQWLVEQLEQERPLPAPPVRLAA